MKLSVISILVFASISGYAQSLVNDGGGIFLGEKSLLYVSGDFVNKKGSVLNNGNLEIKGNFKNEDLSSIVFESPSTSKGVVSLSGAEQTISSPGVIVFPSLSLSGSGDKTLERNIEIEGVLSLGDKHLKVESFSVYLKNPNAEALKRGDEGSTSGSGFISTTGGGTLLRKTTSDEIYLFPLGSLTGASILYRPISIQPSNSLENTFSASLINSDPSAQGYDIKKKRYDVKTVSDKYYYILGQKQGTSKFDITFTQNSATDNNYTQLVSWGTYLQWEKAAPSSVAPMTPEDDLNGGTLNTSIKFSSIDPFQSTAFTFSSEMGGVNPFTFFNAFSPDGDNKNDTWKINNIELYPDNKLSIYNRWGDEVFNAKSYTNNKAWDGGNLQPGTYYYVLTAIIENQPRVFKGFITMIKKN
ncbi:MAG: gliding motility-associated C-terminal domain-containing protein [Sphingobacteriaceae bacterium]|nr:gliding motility-associated C-terminal domain-containing protein [Sphingobacteriaceae bacterium]